MEYWTCDGETATTEEVEMRAPGQGKSSEPVHGTVGCLLARLLVLLVGCLSIMLTVMSSFYAVLTLVPSMLLIVGWWRHLAASIGFLWLGLCSLFFGLCDPYRHNTTGYVIAGALLLACAAINFLAAWMEKEDELNPPQA
jgi:hypothetical protein